MIGVAGGVEGYVFGGLVAPLFEVGVLVLESVRQLMGEHWLLLVDVDPVKHVDGLGFGVVVGFDLLLEQREEKRLEVEIAVEHTEFLEHDFSALEAFCVLVVVEFFLEVAFDGSAGGELALDGAFDGQAGFGGGELDELVDERKELFGLLGGDVGGRLGGVGGGGLGESGWRGQGHGCGQEDGRGKCRNARGPIGVCRFDCYLPRVGRFPQVVFLSSHCLPARLRVGPGFYSQGYNQDAVRSQAGPEKLERRAEKFPND